MLKALMGGGGIRPSRSSKPSSSSSSRHRDTDSKSSKSKSHSKHTPKPARSSAASSSASTITASSSRYSNARSRGGDDRDRDRGLGDLETSSSYSRKSAPKRSSSSYYAPSLADESVADSYVTADSSGFSAVPVERGSGSGSEPLIIERKPRYDDDNDDDNDDNDGGWDDDFSRRERERVRERERERERERDGNRDRDRNDQRRQRRITRSGSAAGDIYPSMSGARYDENIPVSHQDFVTAPTPPTSYDPHVQQQFPGQMPEFDAAYTDPFYQSPNDNSVGEAADYYGDQGQSVSAQPGVRPSRPAIIPNSQPHLTTASATPNPPPEPSSMGQVGAAAAYYDSNDFPGEVTPQPAQDPSFAPNVPPTTSATYGAENSPPTFTNTGYPQPSSPSVGYGLGILPFVSSYGNGGGAPQTSSPNATYSQPAATSPEKPSYSYGVSPILGAAAATTAAGYALGHHNHHHHSSSGQTSPNQHQNQHRPSKPNNKPFFQNHNSSALFGAGAAGAAGYATSAANATHGTGHNYPSLHSGSMYSHSSSGTTMGFQRRQRGPLSKFIDFWKDPEGVGRFEDYTETIGVCKHCFEPGTTSRDAPRKHHYRSRSRRYSGDRYSTSTGTGSGSRIDKYSRYGSSDDESRKSSSKRNSWLTGMLSGEEAKSALGSKRDRGYGKDYYSSRSGRGATGSTYGSESFLNLGRRSPSHRHHHHRQPHRHSNRSRSPHRIDDGYYSDARRSSRGVRRTASGSECGSALKRASLGATIGSTILGTSKSRHRSRSPKKDRRRKTSLSSSSFTSSGSSSLGTSRRHGKNSAGSGFGTFFSTPSQDRGKKKNRSSNKNRRGIFSWSRSDTSSSSSLDADLAFGGGGDGRNGYSPKRTGSSSKKGKKNNDHDLDATLRGLGAAATALVNPSSRDGQRRRTTGEIYTNNHYNKNRDIQSRSRYGSGPESDEWEDAGSDRSSSDVSSGLAFGDSPVFGGSNGSMSSSNSSGTSRWGWRWGSKKDRDRDRNTKQKQKQREPSSEYLPAGAAAAAGEFGAGVIASAYGKDKRKQDRVQSSRDSQVGDDLKEVFPVATSDPTRFDAARVPSSSTSGVYPPPLVRPGPIPLQQPQPVTPVSQAVYYTQPESSHARTAPITALEPPPDAFQRFKYQPQDPLTANRNQYTASTNTASNRFSTKQRNEQVPVSAPARSSSTTPATSTVGPSHQRQHSLPSSIKGSTNSRDRDRERDPATVQFDLTQEQEDKQRRTEYYEKRNQQVNDNNDFDDDYEYEHPTVQLIDREGEELELLERERRQEANRQRELERERAAREADRQRKLEEKRIALMNYYKEKELKEKQQELAHREAELREKALRDRAEEEDRRRRSRELEEEEAAYNDYRAPNPRSYTSSGRRQQDEGKGKGNETSSLGRTAAAAVAGAIGGSVVTSALSNKKDSDEATKEESQLRYDKKREKRRSDRRQGSGSENASEISNSPSKAGEPEEVVTTSSSNSLTDEQWHVKTSAFRAISDTRPKLIHDDYSKFFAPEELQQELQAANVHHTRRESGGQSDPMFDVLPGIEPESETYYSRDIPVSSSTYPGQNGYGAFPWLVPRLKLIPPTPDESETGTVINVGDAQPEPVPETSSEDADVYKHFDDRQSTSSRVSWGGHQTHEYEVLSSTSDDHVDDVAAKEPSTAKQVDTTEKPSTRHAADEMNAYDEPRSRSGYSEHDQEDVEFTATLAAAAAAAGFDPDVVMEGQMSPKSSHSTVKNVIVPDAPWQQRSEPSPRGNDAHGYVEGEVDSSDSSGDSDEGNQRGISEGTTTRSVMPASLPERNVEKPISISETRDGGDRNEPEHSKEQHVFSMPGGFEEEEEEAVEEKEKNEDVFETDSEATSDHSRTFRDDDLSSISVSIASAPTRIESRSGKHGEDHDRGDREDRHSHRHRHKHRHRHRHGDKDDEESYARDGSPRDVRSEAGIETFQESRRRHKKRSSRHRSSSRGHDSDHGRHHRHSTKSRHGEDKSHRRRREGEEKERRRDYDAGSGKKGRSSVKARSLSLSDDAEEDGSEVSEKSIDDDRAFHPIHSSRMDDAASTATGLSLGPLALSELQQPRPSSHPTSPVKESSTSKPPQSRPTSPLLGHGPQPSDHEEPHHQRRPSILKGTESPTAIPVQFFRPPASPRAHTGDSPSRSQSPLPGSPTHHPSPIRHKKGGSTEFKNSREFRPLWLVERHGSAKAESLKDDEPLPSLPSSRSVSATSSNQPGHYDGEEKEGDGDGYEQPWERGLVSAIPNQAVELSRVFSSAALIRRDGYGDDYDGEGSHGLEREGISGSGQVTPTAETFGAIYSPPSTTKPQDESYRKDSLTADETIPSSVASKDLPHSAETSDVQEKGVVKDNKDNREREGVPKSHSPASSERQIPSEPDTVVPIQEIQSAAARENSLEDSEKQTPEPDLNLENLPPLPDSRPSSLASVERSASEDDIFVPAYEAVEPSATLADTKALEENTDYDSIQKTASKGDDNELDLEKLPPLPDSRPSSPASVEQSASEDDVFVPAYEEQVPGIYPAENNLSSSWEVIPESEKGVVAVNTEVPTSPKEEGIPSAAVAEAGFEQQSAPTVEQGAEEKAVTETVVDEGSAIEQAEPISGLQGEAPDDTAAGEQEKLEVSRREYHERPSEATATALTGESQTQPEESSVDTLTLPSSSSKKKKKNKKNKKAQASESVPEDSTIVPHSPGAEKSVAKEDLNPMQEPVSATTESECDLVPVSDNHKDVQRETKDPVGGNKGIDEPQGLDGDDKGAQPEPQTPVPEADVEELSAKTTSSKKAKRDKKKKKQKNKAGSADEQKEESTPLEVSQEPVAETVAEEVGTDQPQRVEEGSGVNVEPAVSTLRRERIEPDSNEVPSEFPEDMPSMPAMTDETVAFKEPTEAVVGETKEIPEETQVASQEQLPNITEPDTTPAPQQPTETIEEVADEPAQPSSVEVTKLAEDPLESSREIPQRPRDEEVIPTSEQHATEGTETARDLEGFLGSSEIPAESKEIATTSGEQETVEEVLVDAPEEPAQSAVGTAVEPFEEQKPAKQNITTPDETKQPTEEVVKSSQEFEPVETDVDTTVQGASEHTIKEESAVPEGPSHPEQQGDLPSDKPAVSAEETRLIEGNTDVSNEMVQPSIPDKKPQPAADVPLITNENETGTAEATSATTSAAAKGEVESSTEHAHEVSADIEKESESARELATGKETGATITDTIPTVTDQTQEAQPEEEQVPGSRKKKNKKGKKKNKGKSATPSEPENEPEPSTAEAQPKQGATDNIETAATQTGGEAKHEDTTRSTQESDLKSTGDAEFTTPTETGESSTIPVENTKTNDDPPHLLDEPAVNLQPGASTQPDLQVTGPTSTEDDKATQGPSSHLGEGTGTALDLPADAGTSNTNISPALTQESVAPVAKPSSGSDQPSMDTSDATVEPGKSSSVEENLGQEETLAENGSQVDTHQPEEALSVQPALPVEEVRMTSAQKKRAKKEKQKKKRQADMPNEDDSSVSRAAEEPGQKAPVSEGDITVSDEFPKAEEAGKTAARAENEEQPVAQTENTSLHDEQGTERLPEGAISSVDELSTANEADDKPATTEVSARGKEDAEQIPETHGATASQPLPTEDAKESETPATEEVPETIEPALVTEKHADENPPSRSNKSKKKDKKKKRQSLALDEEQSPPVKDKEASDPPLETASATEGAPAVTESVGNSVDSTAKEPTESTNEVVEREEVQETGLTEEAHPTSAKEEARKSKKKNKSVSWTAEEPNPQHERPVASPPAAGEGREDRKIESEEIAPSDIDERGESRELAGLNKSVAQVPDEDKTQQVEDREHGKSTSPETEGRIETRELAANDVLDAAGSVQQTEEPKPEEIKLPEADEQVEFKELAETDESLPPTATELPPDTHPEQLAANEAAGTVQADEYPPVAQGKATEDMTGVETREEKDIKFTQEAESVEHKRQTGLEPAADQRGEIDEPTEHIPEPDTSGQSNPDSLTQPPIEEAKPEQEATSSKSKKKKDKKKRKQQKSLEPEETPTAIPAQPDVDTQKGNDNNTGLESTAKAKTPEEDTQAPGTSNDEEEGFMSAEETREPGQEAFFAAFPTPESTSKGTQGAPPGEERPPIEQGFHDVAEIRTPTQVEPTGETDQRPGTLDTDNDVFSSALSTSDRAIHEREEAPAQTEDTSTEQPSRGESEYVPSTEIQTPGSEHETAVTPEAEDPNESQSHGIEEDADKQSKLVRTDEIVSSQVKDQQEKPPYSAYSPSYEPNSVTEQSQMELILALTGEEKDRFHGQEAKEEHVSISNEPGTSVEEAKATEGEILGGEDSKMANEDDSGTVLVREEVGSRQEPTGEPQSFSDLAPEPTAAVTIEPKDDIKGNEDRSIVKMDEPPTMEAHTTIVEDAGDARTSKPEEFPAAEEDTLPAATSKEKKKNKKNKKRKQKEQEIEKVEVLESSTAEDAKQEAVEPPGVSTSEIKSSVERETTPIHDQPTDQATYGNEDVSAAQNMKELDAPEESPNVNAAEPTVTSKKSKKDKKKRKKQPHPAQEPESEKKEEEQQRPTVEPEVSKLSNVGDRMGEALKAQEEDQPRPSVTASFEETEPGTVRDTVDFSVESQTDTKDSLTFVEQTARELEAPAHSSVGEATLESERDLSLATLAATEKPQLRFVAGEAAHVASPEEAISKEPEESKDHSPSETQMAKQTEPPSLLDTVGASLPTAQKEMDSTKFNDGLEATVDEAVPEEKRKSEDGPIASSVQGVGKEESDAGLVGPESLGVEPSDSQDASKEPEVSITGHYRDDDVVLSGAPPSTQEGTQEREFQKDNETSGVRQQPGLEFSEQFGIGPLEHDNTDEAQDTELRYLEKGTNVEDSWPSIEWEKVEGKPSRQAHQTSEHEAPDVSTTATKVTKGFDETAASEDPGGRAEGHLEALKENVPSMSKKEKRKNKKDKKKNKKNSPQEDIDEGQSTETPVTQQGLASAYQGSLDEPTELMDERATISEKGSSPETAVGPQSTAEEVHELSRETVSGQETDWEMVSAPTSSQENTNIPSSGDKQEGASEAAHRNENDQEEEPTALPKNDNAEEQITELGVHGTSANTISEASIAASDIRDTDGVAVSLRDNSKEQEQSTALQHAAYTEQPSTPVEQGPQITSTHDESYLSDERNAEARPTEIHREDTDRSVKKEDPKSELDAECPLHGETPSIPGEKKQTPTGETVPKPLQPQPSRELRPSSPIHEQHSVTPKEKEPSSQKPRQSIFGGPVGDPEPVSPPRTPQVAAQNSGTPQLEVKPEHTLPPPETSLDRFTKKNPARQQPSNKDEDPFVEPQSGKRSRGLSKRLSMNAWPSEMLKTPEQDKPILRPSSTGSASSLGSMHSVDSARSLKRKTGGDLRAASRRQHAQPPLDVSVEHIASSSSYDPVTDKGKRPVRGMTDVYEGWGVSPPPPRSPTRPPSVRHRRSMQHLQELEFRLDQLVSENRLLSASRDAAENKLKNTSVARRKSDQALNTSAADLRDREAEVDQLRNTVDWLQKEVSRLTGENETLTATNTDLSTAHADELKTAHEQSARELDELRSQNERMSTGMDEIVRREIEVALDQKNAELRRLREQLETTRDKVRELQQQISASLHDNVIVFRDEDYFDAACQKLCGHVQQWVLRFSKHSDHHRCRKLSDIHDEKLVDRFDNAILDGSDVEAYLADRVRRRDVFMSVVMGMVWEYIFTRYLFGMDREQRQKLKALEKQLNEVGPHSAVHRWRATTLTLLAKRPPFAKQRQNDTEAVALEIFDNLSRLLPPPSQVEAQLLESLRKVLRVAVNLSIEMRSQLAEYIMLPPQQPEYDINGNLSRHVHFNASLMNERSGETTSNEELEAQRATVRMVLFPLVVKKGNDVGEGDDEIVVCPAQVLVARPDKKLSKMTSGDRMSLGTSKSVHSVAPSSTMDMSNIM